MKRLTLLLVLGLVCAYNYQLQNSASNTTHRVEKEKKHPVIEGRVVGIKDGDTIEILTGDKQLYTIRLAHVDTPERSQAYGKRAKQFTSDFCYGKQVSCSITSTDLYKRSIGLVMVDGEELNLAIIEAGYGWHYKKYSKSKIHVAAELAARKQELGLWSDKRAVAPWDYRVQQRASTSN